MKYLAAILLLCLTASASAQSVQPQSYHKAEVGVTHDGDTISLMIDLGWQIKLGWVQVRIADMDAWEINRSRIQVAPFSTFNPAEWSEEIRKGTKARDDLKELIAKGQVWVTPDPNRDPYGRTSAKVYVQTATELISVAAWMKAKGNTRR